jgi:ABC-type multidrug transport system fused ATPase/permease subunit
MAVVLQDTHLFSGTVTENISFGAPGASRERIAAAAQLANAVPFIERLPDGYDTRLNQADTALSQGQCQLLAIARAALADPAVLILDEATSNVDTRTEMHIQQAMVRLMKGRTSLIIAHRLSTIRDADVILVLDGGRLVESGSHAELIARDGAYAALCRR